MNKKEIKKLISSNMDAHIPMDAPKIHWATVDQMRLEEPTIKTVRAWSSPFKLSLGLSLMVLFALGLFALLYNPIEPEIPLGEALFYEQKDVLSVSFVSTAALIPEYDQQLSSSGIRLMALDTSPIERIKPYLGMIENLLAQDQGFSSTVLPSDLEDYDTKLEIITYDLLGHPITYYFYYNVDAYEIDDDDEETFEISGLMILHNLSYQMIGEKWIEDGESKLKVKGFLDDLNYIESIYKVESDESSYEVNRVVNGILESSSMIKIEFDEADEMKIEIEIDSINEISSYEFKYELEDEQPIIKAEYEVFDRINDLIYQAELRISVQTDLLTGTTSYSMIIKDEDNEEYEYESERDVKTDDDEEDDEEDPEDEEDSKDEDDHEDDEADEPEDDDLDEPEDDES
ncbi:MAG: hypothetical protein C4537_07420 [Acholeplasma sp.]|jgi:hypothetical protein|nr:MAG: hypothetical protein C4537_07420 [Acholeplasma sp.]